MDRPDRETDEHRFLVESEEQKTTILLCYELQRTLSHSLQILLHLLNADNHYTCPYT